jgi:hypothetical protein
VRVEACESSWEFSLLHAAWVAGPGVQTQSGRWDGDGGWGMGGQSGHLHATHYPGPSPPAAELAAKEPRGDPSTGGSGIFEFLGRQPSKSPKIPSNDTCISTHPYSRPSVSRFEQPRPFGDELVAGPTATADTSITGGRLATHQVQVQSSLQTPLPLSWHLIPDTMMPAALRKSQSSPAQNAGTQTMPSVRMLQYSSQSLTRPFHLKFSEMRAILLQPSAKGSGCLSKPQEPTAQSFIREN